MGTVGGVAGRVGGGDCARGGAARWVDRGLGGGVLVGSGRVWGGGWGRGGRCGARGAWGEEAVPRWGWPGVARHLARGGPSRGVWRVARGGAPRQGAAGCLGGAWGEEAVPRRGRPGVSVVRTEAGCIGFSPRGVGWTGGARRLVAGGWTCRLRGPEGWRGRSGLEEAFGLGRLSGALGVLGAGAGGWLERVAAVPFWGQAVAGIAWQGLWPGLVARGLRLCGCLAGGGGAGRALAGAAWA